MDNNFNKLRKSTFGGFNRKDVVSYIENARNEYFGEKVKLESELKTVKGEAQRLKSEKKALEVRISELEGQLKAGEKEKAALIKAAEDLKAEIAANAGACQEDSVNEINLATSHLKDVADELCNSLRDFIERISENSYSVVIKAQEEEDAEPEEKFDGEKFMAELEAQLYSKLGLGEAENEIQSFDTQVPEDNDSESYDRISSILSSVSGFSVNCESVKKEQEHSSDESHIEQILSGLSFLK